MNKTPEAIFELARQPSTIHKVLSVLRALEPDESSVGISVFYEGLQAQQHVDTLTVLCACSRLIAPSAYLEIGVRRGRTMAIVASESHHADLYGFDMWIEGYGGMPNPGPEFVESEIRKIGANRIELMTGNSHQTVPAFFAEHPGKQFDLILVDGDHSAEGAREDLLSVLSRVAPGGAIVFDDIVHPMHHYLEDVWCEVMQDRGFLSATYTSTGYGVAIALSGSEPFSTL